MKLSHNGDEWHGTFGLTLGAMLTDLLSDGEPVRMLLTIDTEDGPRLHDVLVRGWDRRKNTITHDADAVLDADTVLAAEAL